MAGAEEDRRRRLTQRLVPLVVIAVGAFAVGVYAAATREPPEQKVAEKFARAWQRSDYATMYALVADDVRATVPFAQFLHAYREAARLATARTIGVALPVPEPSHGTVAIGVRFRTRLFGTVKGKVRLPFIGDGDDTKIDWSPNLTFPGVGKGEQLTRTTRMPPRAAILARDGSPLAQGSDRTTNLSPEETQIVGRLGDPPADQIQALQALGYPDTVQVGVSGLERAFEQRLAGTPSGELKVGGRVIATSRGTPGRTVRSSIDREIERSAVQALGGRLGGVAVLDPKTGEVLALSGIAFSGLQPPGSTFKVITTAAALEAKLVKLTDQFPVTSAATLSGVRLENANGEFCGGNFEHSFAHSCNSVFAPLGAKVGGPRLTAMAERFGFNKPIGIPGAATSTIPPGDQIGDELAVGSSAIGQGKVQATALQMASVAATIASGGVRSRPTLVRGTPPFRRRAVATDIAATIRRLMVGVVQNGTGTAAAIPNIVVAGKTGTAELGNAPGGEQIPGDTDAWFIAFAPARNPVVAIGVLVVRAGAGGAIAAPVARQVLITALQRR
jgi:cell division protein FtsI/penicillin-binding protein 2